MSSAGCSAGVLGCVSSAGLSSAGSSARVSSAGVLGCVSSAGLSSDLAIFKTAFGLSHFFKLHVYIQN